MAYKFTFTTERKIECIKLMRSFYSQSMNLLIAKNAIEQGVIVQEHEVDVFQATTLKSILQVPTTKVSIEFCETPRYPVVLRMPSYV